MNKHIVSNKPSSRAIEQVWIPLLLVLLNFNLLQAVFLIERGGGDWAWSLTFIALISLLLLSLALWLKKKRLLWTALSLFILQTFLCFLL